MTCSCNMVLKCKEWNVDLQNNLFNFTHFKVSHSFVTAAAKREVTKLRLARGKANDLIPIKNEKKRSPPEQRDRRTRIII